VRDLNRLDTARWTPARRPPHPAPLTGARTAPPLTRAGKVENTERFMRVALHQGAPKRKVQVRAVYFLKYAYLKTRLF
jgi:hypothetical protein